MKVRKLAIVAYALVIAMLLPIGSMVATADNAVSLVVPDYPEPYIYGEGEDNLSIDVHYEPGKVFDIIVTDKRTGKEYHSNPVFQDEKLSLNEEMTKLLKSQLVLHYSFDPNGSQSALQDVGYISSSSKEAKLYSYDDCVVKEQVDFKEIVENGRRVGYRVEYGLGDTRPALFPKFLLASQAEKWINSVPEDQREKFKKDFESRYKLINIENELAKIEREVNRLDNQADKDKKREQLMKDLNDLIAQIPKLQEEDGYELYPDNYSVAFKRGQMVKMWEMAGYTRFDLESDYAESGYVDNTGSLSFTIPVEYRLEGNTLKVTILTKEIKYPAEVAILRIDLLPSFISSGVEDKGYILVPDGSGSLIELNKVDQRSTSFQVQIMSWAKDEALSQLNYTIRDIPYYEQAIMPVFGHKTENWGVFGIIEKGYEIANILATTTDNQTKLNLTYVAFFPTQRDQIYYNTGESSGIQMFPKVTVKEEKRSIDAETKEEVVSVVTRRYCRLPDTDLVVRYNFLESDKIEYYDMANFFRTYLINTFGLNRIAEETGVPFYADIYGIIDKKVSYAGFPINVKYPLTTFEEAEEIVEALQNLGVGEMKLRYMYIANGGAVQTYGNKFKVSRRLGGSKGYEEFYTAMAEKNVSVFPNVDPLHVYKDQMFEGFAPRQDAIETLGMTVSIIVDRNLATGVADYYRKREYYHPRWAVSPSLYEKTFDGLKRALAKYDNKHLALGPVGSILNSDFDSDLIVDRTQTSRILANELKKLKQDGYEIIVERGYFHTLPYVSDVLNIPMTSSRFIVEYYEVPFVQMVLHGLVEYAGEPLNVTQDVKYTIMKCLEYGAGVYGRFMHENDSVFQNTYFDNLYSMDYRNWLEETETIYNAVKDSIGDVRNQFIVKHERLATGVYRTTYEKGKQVVVNYSDVEYVDREGWSVAPGGFQVFEGAK